MAHLLIPPKLRFLDSNGDPLVGGKLYSYAAGTSTPLATFTSKTEAGTNANPTILDANGEASVWIGSSAYKFVLKDANDITLFTQDNISFLNDGVVTTVKLADGSVTTDKLGDASVSTAKLHDDSVTNAKMADSSVGTSELINGSVTQAKRAALGQQVSSATAHAYTTASTSFVIPTNLTVTITTTGRPVRLELQDGWDGTTTSYPHIGITNTSSNIASAATAFFRGSTQLTNSSLGQTSPNASTGGASSMSLPPSAFSYIDTPAAGTYTYTFKVKNLNSVSIDVDLVKLLAYEL